MVVCQIAKQHAVVRNIETRSKVFISEATCPIIREQRYKRGTATADFVERRFFDNDAIVIDLLLSEPFLDRAC